MIGCFNFRCILCALAGDLATALKSAQAASRGGRGRGKGRGKFGRGVQGKGRDAPSSSGTTDSGRRGRGGSRGAHNQGTRYCYQYEGEKKKKCAFHHLFFGAEPGHIAARCVKKEVYGKNCDFSLGFG